MNKPIKRKVALRRVAFRLDPDLIDKVTILSDSQKVTPSDVYRHIVTTFFSDGCQQNVDKNVTIKG